MSNAFEPIIGLIQQLQELIKKKDAEIVRLKEKNESLRGSRREMEDQLCRIADCLGGDARQAPVGDKTIAGLTIETVGQLRQKLADAEERASDASYALATFEAALREGNYNLWKEAVEVECVQRLERKFGRKQP